MQYSRYFQDELSALRELGREFSEQNPRLAPFLSVEGQDPDVERLLEGFAFLAGRIRQKLDDDLPEFAWSLIKLIWPHFLQTIPSITTLELQPMEILSERQRLEKGAEIKSHPVDGTSCHFQTAFDVDLYPLRVESVNTRDLNGRSIICMNLQLFQQGNLASIKDDRLRLHLHGAFSKTSLWYYLLRQKLTQIDIWGSRDGERIKLGTLPASSMQPGGIGSSEVLLPSLNAQLSGHRLLFEYFCFPEKFLYLDLHGLNRLLKPYIDSNDAAGETLVDEWGGGEPPDALHLEFVLDHMLIPNNSPRTENIRLFCTPAINQFQMALRPFLRDRRRVEHRAAVEASTPDHYEILNIDKLEGWSPDTRTLTEYPRFETFGASSQSSDSSDSVVSSSGTRTAFWAQQRSPVSGKGLETYITFVPVTQSKISTHEIKQRNVRAYESSSQPETISGQVTCSNRHLPSLLNVGDVCVATSTIPEYLQCRNISAITPSYSPVTRLNWLWRLISLSRLNIHKIKDLDSLKSLIGHFDVRGLFDKQQQLATKLKLEGMESLTVTPAIRLFKGIPVRGSEVVLVVSSEKFAGLGDIYLFGEMLNQFFSRGASVNSFQRLTINTRPEGDVIQWAARVGDCQL